MKFHCEYCRELIDADKDKKCPSCGATYKDNKEYKKLLEEKEQQKEQIKKQQEFVQKQVMKVGKTAGVFAVAVPLLAFVIMGIIIFIGVREAKKNDNDFDTTFNKIEEKINDTIEDVEKEPVIVNQEKSSNDYKVKFEKYKLEEQKDDNEFDKLEITLIIEKISDTFMANGEEIYCLVDNVSQKYDPFNSDTINYIKDKNIPETRKMTYYVPKNVKSFDIKYGNEVSFHIDIEND